LPTTILDESQRKRLNEVMLQLVQKQLDKTSKWQLAMESSKDCDPLGFEKVHSDVLKKPPYLILLEGINGYSEKKCVVGVFCTSQIKKEFTVEDDFQRWDIPASDDNFFFCYEEGQSFHISAA
jgi:hypothetical protein